MNQVKKGFQRQNSNDHQGLILFKNIDICTLNVSKLQSSWVDDQNTRETEKNNKIWRK